MTIAPPLQITPSSKLRFSASPPDALAPFLEPTKFTTSECVEIGGVAHVVSRHAATPNEKSRALFYYVRDHVDYQLGIYPHTATQTWEARYGSCSHKANLLVAMHRAVGIPAGFCSLRVKTAEYFGPFAIDRVAQFVSETSWHICAMVFLNDQWIRADCSDDIRLCRSGAHLGKQLLPTDFDGHTHADLHLDPEHIIFRSEQPAESIDDILGKPSRLPVELRTFMNLWLNHVRHFGAAHERISSLEKHFFEWLKANRPEILEAVLQAEEFLRHRASAEPAAS